MRRTIVVGDIHGCLGELRALLLDVGFGPEDLLVAVGDLVDRGPEPWKVATFFRETPNAMAVLGNHDRRVAGTVRGTSKPAWSQAQTLSRIPESEHAGWAAWLETLPVVIETPHALVVHGRLDPLRPLDRQDAYHACAVGGAELQIEVDTEGVPLWFRALDKLGLTTKSVCIGHIGYARVELVPGRLYALDTGACVGTRLTAVVLPEGRVVSVPAAKDWAAVARAEWDASQRAAFNPWDIAWRHFVRLRDRPERTASEEWEVARVQEALSSLDLPRRFGSLREGIVGLAGEPPEDGPARGEWFRSVARLLGPGVNGRLVGQVVSRPHGSAPLALELLGVRSPGGVRDSLVVLEEALARHGARPGQGQKGGEEQLVEEPDQGSDR